MLQKLSPTHRQLGEHCSFRSVEISISSKISIEPILWLFSIGFEDEEMRIVEITARMVRNFLMMVTFMINN